MYNEHDDKEYQAFCLLSTKMKEEVAYSFELFLGSFLDLLKKM